MRLLVFHNVEHLFNCIWNLINMRSNILSCFTGVDRVWPFEGHRWLWPVGRAFLLEMPVKKIEFHFRSNERGRLPCSAEFPPEGTMLWPHQGTYIGVVWAFTLGQCCCSSDMNVLIAVIVTSLLNSATLLARIILCFFVSNTIAFHRSLILILNVIIMMSWDYPATFISRLFISSNGLAAMTL